jgi:hypothetical protein
LQSTQCLELASDTALPTGHLVDASKWRSGACNFKAPRKIGEPYPENGLDDFSVFERRMKPAESKVVVDGNVEQVGNVFGGDVSGQSVGRRAWLSDEADGPCRLGETVAKLSSEKTGLSLEFQTNREHYPPRESNTPDDILFQNPVCNTGPVTVGTTAPTPGGACTAARPKLVSVTDTMSLVSRPAQIKPVRNLTRLRVQLPLPWSSTRVSLIL